MNPVNNLFIHIFYIIRVSSFPYGAGNESMYSQQAGLHGYMEGGHGNASQNQMFQSYSTAQGGHPGSMGLGTLVILEVSIYLCYAVLCFYLFFYVNTLVKQYIVLKLNFKSLETMERSTFFKNLCLSKREIDSMRTK